VEVNRINLIIRRGTAVLNKNIMKTFTGKEERINGVWYPVTVKAENRRDAIKKLYVGQRKSYGIVEAIRGRFFEVL
jgi:hypothetical protein